MAYNPFPSLNEQYIAKGIVYVWNGSDWIETKNLNYSFNQIQINKADKFDSFITRNINFEGINLSIYSADSNTIVFSAQPSSNSGTSVTSVTSVTESNNVVTVSKSNNTSSSFTIDAVTSGSYSNGVITLSGTGNVNGTQITGLPTSSSSFTGGTVSGATRFISGLTANTISATTYQNLPATPFLPLTGGTITGNVLINSPTSIGNTALNVISQNTSQSIALRGLAGRGTNAYGVFCDVSPTEENYEITNGIGGYFEVGSQFGNGAPINKYSLQLKDETEGVGKVLTCVTSDGKANWSSVLTGLTNVRSTTISATTYQNLPTDIRITGATYSNNTFTYRNNTGGTFNVLFNTVTGLTVNGNLTVTGTTSLGNGTFTKSGSGRGDILIDNNGTDTPGVLFYYANNSNYGIDSWNATFDVLSGQLFRVTNNLNESGGAVKMAIDTSGNMVVTGFIKANAWRAGQVINDIMLSNTDVTISTTTIATSNSDTDFLTYSYTPLSSSSYLVIHYHLASFSFEGGTGNDSYFSRIKVDGAEITYSRQSTVNGNRTGVLFPLTGRYTNSNTTAKSIVVACRRDSADDSITIVNSSSSMWLRITEIAR